MTLVTNTKTYEEFYESQIAMAEFYDHKAKTARKTLPVAWVVGEFGRPLSIFLRV